MSVRSISRMGNSIDCIPAPKTMDPLDANATHAALSAFQNRAPSAPWIQGQTLAERRKEHRDRLDILKKKIDSASPEDRAPIQEKIEALTRCVSSTSQNVDQKLKKLRKRLLPLRDPYQLEKSAPERIDWLTCQINQSQSINRIDFFVLERAKCSLQLQNWKDVISDLEYVLLYCKDPDLRKEAERISKLI